MQKTLQNQLLVATDRYVIDSILDSGGMGTICLAKDTRWQQSVVVKLLKEPLLNSPGVYQLFQREIELRTNLNHEYITKILDSGVNAEGYPFYVMEYLQGESLEWKLQREKQFSTERVICIARQVCLALETIYETADENDTWLHLCPQNLKPSHIFLVSTPTGEEVRLLDCGITQKVRNYCKDSQSTNLMNLLQGSFHYAAPEQLGLEEETDYRADIYTLGIMLYEMLSGTDPFGLGFNSRVVNEISWIRAHTTQSPPPLHLFLDDCHSSLALSAIVSQCLQKNPDDRYRSIQSLRETLEQIVPSHLPLATESVVDSIHSETALQAAVELNSDSTVIQSLNIKSEGITTCNPIDPSNFLTQQPTDFTMLQGSKRPSPEDINDHTVIQQPPTLSGEESASVGSLTVFGSLENPKTLRDATSDFSQDSLGEETSIQYSDSAIHNPGDQTICQVIPSSIELEADQTVHQFDTPHRRISDTLDDRKDKGKTMSSAVSLYPNFYHSDLKQPGSFFSRFGTMTGQLFDSLRRLINSKSWQSRLHSGQSGAIVKQQKIGSGKQSPEQKTLNETVSTKQHQTAMRELDTCRLAYARELARNGKFRDAIAMARKITDVSRDFKDAQILIQSWEKF
jgi:eukaryotic-like serine/threonine-protein kinase